jgi:hypothetical protein
MTYVAAFRTYTWDEGVAELARRFFKACPAARQVVLADETKGSLNIKDYEVISHTEDTSKYGLLIYPPGNSLWYNVDYGLYILRTALPGYDYYLTSESDLAVNTNIDKIAMAAIDQSIDLIAHWVGPAGEGWMWYADAKAIFEKVFCSVLFFVVASARAIDLMFHIRQQMTIQYNAGAIQSWPFCEAFVPSILKLSDMKIAEVSSFVNTDNLRVRPRILLTDSRANQPNSLAHSVLARPTYIRAIIREHPPREWFSADSVMYESLREIPLHEYSGQLYHSFVNHHDYDGLEKFKAILTREGSVIIFSGSRTT